MLHYFHFLQQGDELIEEFLRNVSQISIENMTEEEVSAKVEKLKEVVLARNNSYIKDMLVRGTAVAGGTDR